jgi:hypothetical protein
MAPLEQTKHTLPTIRHSACPHDSPSSCALEAKRLDDFRIGKVRGATANASPNPMLRSISFS